MVCPNYTTNSVLKDASYTLYTSIILERYTLVLAPRILFDFPFDVSFETS